MTENWYKWPKNGKICIKIDFLYNNFPEKVISVRKCTKIFFAFGEKKVKKFFAPAARNLVMCGDPPPRGGSKFFPPHSHTATHPYTAAWGGSTLKKVKKVTSEMALIGVKSIYPRVPCGWPFIAPPAVRLTGGA